MVFCKFFQQGTCRFGSKCHNDHFDVKQVLTTDVESAINGKQWPLSSYGPFKDKPSIPNFIEDRSFEEVRLLCYEAKQKNFFEQFQQQFTKEALEASNKMKALLQMTPEILDVVIQCYEAPGPDGAATTVKPNNNAFAMGANATSAGSIFAKTTTTAPTNNIFGGGNQGTFGSVATSGTGIFGGAANPQASNVFGGSSAFSQPQQQQSGNSIFGGSISNQQPTSLFGQQQQQPQAAMGGNLFAQAAPVQQQAPPSGGFGLFAQQQPQQQQQSSMFSQPQQSTGIFGQSAMAQQNMQQQDPNTGQGLFAQAAQQTQNLFGQAMQQQQQQPQQQVPTTNIFQQSQPNQNQQQPIQEQPPPPAPTGIFKQAALQTQNPPPAYNNTVNSSLYSRMEDLTPEEIDLFKADSFQPGKLPLNPPPRELVN